MSEGTAWPGFVLAAALASCGGGSATGAETDGAGTGVVDTDTSDGGCGPADHAPATPSITEPTSGDLFPGDLVLASSAFSDVDGDSHIASEFEIRYKLDGNVGTLAWSAHVTDPAGLRSVTLADGQFEVGGQLADRATFVARVRYQDAGNDCNWSEWSDGREFSTDESLYLFDPEQVLAFEITIPPESWGPINNEAIAPGCVQYSRNYYTGTLTFQGQVFEGVGLRSKGGCGSSRNLDEKAAFKINLNWDDPDVPGCPVERRLFGLDTLTLNNGVQDPSATHERMAHRFYRAAGVPAPRAVSARVYVNGEYWGLYQHVESINRRFLKRWFENPKGMMYEGAYWCDLVEENLPATDEGDTCFQREFSDDECDPPAAPGADPKDWELLRGWTQQLATLGSDLYPAVESIMDFDMFLTMMAVETVDAHWDGYPWSLNNNYRAYHDPVLDDWSVLPWGVDQTFEEPDFDPWNEASGVLSRACLEQPACEAAYAARVHQMVDLFEQLDFDLEANAIREQIRTHVEEDPRKEYGMQEWESEVDNALDFISGRAEFVRSTLAAHGY